VAERRLNPEKILFMYRDKKMDIFFSFVLVGIEPTTSHMLSKGSTTEPYAHPKWTLST
jgi:hypothetical protein